jgi:hypothetical protein
MIRMNVDSSTVRLTSGVRRICVVFLAVLSVLLATAPLTWAKKHKASSPPTDSSYVAALATANRFLAAWQGNDQEAGLPLITNRAKHQRSEADIDKLFSGASARAFEITHGRQLSHGRYLFPVLLLQGGVRRYTEIVIVNTGTNDWAVDKLP